MTSRTLSLKIWKHLRKEFANINAIAQGLSHPIDRNKWKRLRSSSYVGVWREIGIDLPPEY